MLNVNQVHVAGQVYNLKRAETKSGKTIAKFTISTWKKGSEGYEDKVTFHNIVAYGKVAEVILNNVKEKELLYVIGEIEMFTNPEGKQFNQILLNEFQFVNKKSA